MCWLVGMSLEADAPGRAKTLLSAYLAQHLRVIQPITQRVLITLSMTACMCVPTFHKLRIFTMSKN